MLWQSELISDFRTRTPDKMALCANLLFIEWEQFLKKKLNCGLIFAIQS
ncbi:hypothetical protein SAMN06269250_0661 [Spirosoma fluviale]|uniref:Uncharacterized protein n=1 Tax=Spirosoma fluviale TaxID=1597977 RepID=A0A286F6G8_9BACT|nr:hypothetical protein SAMN06269250_0661 [Spirosoma fluviale]